MLNPKHAPVFSPSWRVRFEAQINRSDARW
jgi:hypothetical protein